MTNGMETVYRADISLCAGIAVDAEGIDCWNLCQAQGSAKASRLVILSADAPEWAMVALRPNGGPRRAFGALK
jgi:hypothetical protein